MIWLKWKKYLATQPPIIVPLSTKDIGKKYSDLSVCVKDGQQLKDILFTTKAMGVGIGLKDRGVKHIFIDQWNPLEIAQSLGRKRSLDADDTCTVYFRDYSLDWYWGTNSGLKKFRRMLLNKYLPAQAYMAGEEEFDKYLHSDDPEVIQKRIDKSKILEHNVVHWIPYQSAGGSTGRTRYRNA